MIDRVLEDGNIDMDNHSNDSFTVKSIIGHIGPLKSTDPSYNGSLWNVRVMKRDGSVEDIPLQMM